MQDLTGRDIGRYHIVERLGVGGMATVYKAFDNRLERYVAIKVIRTDMFGESVLEEVLKRFEREAKALARVAHPHIVKIHDYGDFEGMPYLIMEYLPGGTLKRHTGKPMNYVEAAKLLAPVARALEYAHKENILHRDIKPANILIDQSGQPMLTDFGIAKILETQESTGLTASGVGIGTPEYMAPEQGMGVAVGARADIYSLGVVFYELVTGKRPFSADTPMAVLVKHITEPLPRARHFVPELPEEVEGVIFKALAKKPEERYQNMGEFAAALEWLGTFPAPTARSMPVHPSSSRGSTQLPGTVQSHARTRTVYQTAAPGVSIPQTTSKRGNYGVWIVLGALGLIGCLVLGGLLVSKILTLMAAPDPSATAQSQIAAIIPTQLLIPEISKTPTVNFLPTETNTPQPTATTTITPTSQPEILAFYTCTNTPCRSENNQSTFSEGTRVIFLHWEFQNVVPGLEYTRKWSWEGAEWVRYQCVWEGPNEGTVDIALREPDGLASGTWEVSITVGGVELLNRKIQLVGNWTYWAPVGVINSCYDK